MKKSSRILIVVLAAVFFVGTLALAVFASDKNEVNGKFVVAGSGYETWEEAVLAADNTHTIYLNEDITLGKKTTISGDRNKLKINLNGNAIKVTGSVAAAFEVKDGATFVLEGSGLINNAAATFVSGTSSAVVSINGTGSGIVINNDLVNTAADVNTFRLYGSSTLNVKGKITVNTNGDTKSRTLFNVAAADNAAAATINIDYADILYATPSVTGCPTGRLIYSKYSTINIQDSRLEIVYGTVIESATGGYLDISDYTVKDAAKGARWIESELANIKKSLSITFEETIAASNSVFSTIAGTNYTSYVDGNLMKIPGSTKAVFDECVFYCYGRAIAGNSSYSVNSSSTASDTVDGTFTHAANTNQLIFTDCHIKNNKAANRTPYYLFGSGCNFKFLGGSINNFIGDGYGRLAYGQPHYIELTNEDGTPSGQWLGGYVDNVLGLSSLTGAKTVVSTNWQNATAYNPDSTIVETLPRSVNVVIDGTEYTFKTGYFSDEDEYNALFPKGLPDGVIHALDGNGITSSSSTADPFKAIYKPATSAGKVSCVLDSNGNGYVKHYYENYTGDTVQSPMYPGFGSFVDTDFIVFEFDVSTEDGNFPHVWGQFQTREYKPLFDEKGNFLAEVGSYLNTPGFDISGNVISSPGTVEVSTEAGVWSRITFVFEIKRGEIEQIQVPAYYNNGTANVPKLDGNGDPVYITKNAFSILGSQVHFYVNGTYVTSVDFAKHNNGTYYGYEYNGKPGYIIEGYESSYKIGNDLRLYMNASSNKKASICYDNFFVAEYDYLTAYELGLYDENNELKSTITPNDYILLMPDNNAVNGEPPVANVDGEEYTVESEALAAIKDGSVVTLLRDMETPIDVEAILANNKLENISFEIIPGKFNFKGVVSSTHKLVDYTGMRGAYLIVPAEDSEIYGAAYVDDEFGVDAVSGGRFAEGTLLPNGEELSDVGEKASEGFFRSISGWEADYGSSVANGFYADKNLSIKLIPAGYSKVPYYYEITSGGETEYAKENVFGESLTAALQNKNVSVKLWSDVTLEKSLTVIGAFDFDLNGNAVTVNADEALNVFELLPGTEINIYSSREGSQINGNGSVTLLYSDYDRWRADTVTVNIGNGALENLSINCTALLNRIDEYFVSGNAGSDDVFEYTKELILTVNGLNLGGSGNVLGDGMIMVSAPIRIAASNLAYNGTSELIVALSNDRVALDASFIDSSFISTETLVRVPGETRSVSFENCLIDAELAQTSTLVGETLVFGGESIVLGEGCKLTFDGKLLQENGIKLKDGCAISYADYESVRCYIDKPEKLALVSWIDVNGNVIGEANYNAPFGKLVELYGTEEVGVAVDSEWYNIEFERWDIPEEFELSAGEYTIYPKWKAPKASVKCLKVDLVAYTYFKLNFYLPTELPDDIELYGIYKVCDDGVDHNGESGYKLIDGEWYKLLDNGEAELGGKKYNSYTAFPGASDASEPEYKIVFAAKGNVLVDTIDYGVPTYAEAVMNNIMKDGSVSGEEEILASLVMNMVRYANESYKLANNITASNGYGAERYEALLEAYDSHLMDFSEIVFSEAEKNVNTSGLGEYMEGASFIFGAYQPRFVFKYRASALEYLVKPETSDGKIYTWPKGNRGVFTQIYHESYDGKESHRYIAPHVAYNNGEYVIPDIVENTWGGMTEAYATTVDMSVRDATGVINLALYTPDGEVVMGSYSLAAYISYLDEASAATNDAALRAKYEAFKSASMSLYAFSLVSQTYDCAVVDK